MADSDLERQRRRRAHLRGDHRACGARCTARRVDRAAASSGAETVVGAVDAFAATVAPWPPEDPRRVTLAVCRRMAEALDAGATDVRISDYVVSAIGGLADLAAGPADVVDELNAQGAARLVGILARLPGA